MPSYLEFLRSLPVKKNTHPKYQKVLFVDSATGFRFVCGTTLHSEETEEFEGETLPVVTVSLSSASHPFFVGGKQYVDAEGRVDKFNKRYQAMKAQPKPAAALPVAHPVKEKKVKKEEKKEETKAEKKEEKKVEKKEKVVAAKKAPKKE
jgi:large subunit ribosomal protein L31